jgi:hypothetical protein
LEDVLRLLNWDAIPDVDPDEPEYPNLVLAFVEGMELMILHRGRDWVGKHPEDVRASWNRLLAIY